MWATLPAVVGLGVDLVHIPRIEESLRDFGPAFEQRLFTPRELADAHAAAGDDARTRRFAACFAAKEATIKALSLSDAGVNWREMELVHGPDGSYSLQLHGTALDKARALGVARALVCLSHGGAYVAAAVAALSDRAAQGA
jgi:holo-[acyl-carrier protein] synthase